MKLFYSYTGRLFAYIPNLLKVAGTLLRIFSPVPNGHRLVIPGRFLLHTTIFVSMFSNAHAQSAGERADAVLANIKPLHIGDTIPEALWHMPLQVINHPDGKDTITLNDYRDRKLIILDFWATWCGACIGSMPKNAKIEEEFPSISIVPVTYESATKVRETVKDNHILKNLKFSSIIDDSTFTALFPHRSVPHLVWIDRQGIVLATTYPDDLNKRNIKEFLSTGDLTFYKKTDILDYNLDEPLTIFKRPDFSNEQITRSSLTKYINGIPSSIGLVKDTSSGGRWFKATNMGVRNLLMWSDPNTKSIPRKLWDIDDKIYDILVDVKDDNSRNWQENNLFCYEFHGRQDLPALRISVKHDIERIFGITMQIVSKDTVQLVLESVSSDYKKAPRPADNKISVARLVFLLNRRIDLPFVVTRIDRKKNFDLNEEIFNSASLDQINRVLKAHGIRLRKEIQKVDFLKFDKLEGGLL